MNELIHNILRGSVSTVMYALLLFTLTKPKVGIRIPFVIAIGIFIINMASSIWFYLYADLTSLSRYTVVLFIVIAVVLKPLTKLNFLQWCFTFLTTINIAMMIIILSFFSGKLFPNPHYANTAIRFLLYFLVILLFKKILINPYKSVVSNWPAFSFLMIAVFLNLSFYFYVTEDIQNTLIIYKWPLLLLVLLCLAAYSTVFFSLKKFAEMYDLETENLNIKNEAKLLHQAASTMTDRLQLMEHISHQQSVASHDRRHFNSMILELLESGDTDEATAILRKQNEVKKSNPKVYCDHKAVNAVTSYYEDMALSKNIATKINLTIPNAIGNIDSIELALVVSNLFENAIHGVSLLADQREKYIHFTCLHTGRLMLEMVNPCLERVDLDDEGFPYTSKENHGVGTASIRAFCNKHEAELMYNVQNGLFRVRILL